VSRFEVVRLKPGFLLTLNSVKGRRIQRCRERRVDMAVKRVNDHEEFCWLSNDEPPIRGPNFCGAKGTTLDTGEKWIYDGTGWVPDLTIIYAFKQAAIGG
jgi:hypothetical protein